MYFCCECCVLQVEVSVLGWSLVQKSPTKCGVSECDLGTSWLRRSWPTRGCCVMKKIMVFDAACFDRWLPPPGTTRCNLLAILYI